VAGGDGVANRIAPCPRRDTRGVPWGLRQPPSPAGPRAATHPRAHVATPVPYRCVGVAGHHLPDRGQVLLVGRDRHHHRPVPASRRRGAPWAITSRIAAKRRTPSRWRSWPHRPVPASRRRGAPWRRPSPAGSRPGYVVHVATPGPPDTTPRTRHGRTWAAWAGMVAMGRTARRVVRRRRSGRLWRRARP
jgi:hypothetical protein